MEREADPGALLRRLVADPLRSAALSEPLIIVVDALDESLGYLERTITKLIAERLDDLPPSVRLVVSSRENAEILDLFSAHSPRAIGATHENNLRDAASFVRSRLTEPPFAEVVRTYDMQIDALSDVILSKSKGNLLYIRHTMDELRTEQFDPTHTHAFTDGLIGVYHAFFQLMFSDAADYATLRPLLDIIVVSRDPLTASHIAACVDRDLFDVEGALQRLADFFPERDGRYQAFHKSVSDWLSGTVGRSRRFHVNQQNGHGLLATQSWR
jgi:hypothetical protein